MTTRKPGIVITPSAQEDRVRLGWQCPECSGVQIETRKEGGYLCTECGCHFGRIPR